MESLWRLCELVALILFGLLDTSHARPIDDGIRDSGPSGATVRVTPRVSQEQKEELLHFMLENPGLATNRIVGPQAAAQKQRLWAKIAEKLNGCSSGATKTPEKWAKVWQDWRCDTKQKAARIKAHARGTGGGPSLKVTALTPLEERLLGILGQVAVEGHLDVPDSMQVLNQRAEDAPIEILIDSTFNLPPTSNPHLSTLPPIQIIPTPTVPLNTPPFTTTPPITPSTSAQYQPFDLSPQPPQEDVLLATSPPQQKTRKRKRPVTHMPSSVEQEEDVVLGAWLTGILGPSLLAAAALMAAGGAALVGCCACCRKTPKGFQEFTDSGSSHSLSTTAGGCVNPAAAASSSSPANEFAIFPPAAPPSGGAPVSFEPLPDIRPRQAAPSAAVATPSRRPSQKKPAAFNNAVSHGLSAQDWFDDPHANFPRSQLKYLCEFGKGWFGRVVEGEALGLSNGANGISPPTRVIVKILHGDATPTDQMYFLHEVRYLKDLTPHPNILQLKGRCLETDPFLIILEACPTGDLKTFLLQNLATSEALSMQGVILRMACNVAAGLQHMHERGFVHTDLAARNCLVASDLTVKIGDYGTSIDNFKEDYYCADDVALPIRWCAPETLHCTDTTIETKEVTTAANIWSFGVLLWELCEFGRLPYSELNDEEIIVKVLSEKSLHLGPPSRPCLQANNLYHLMRLCWSSNHKRPAIAQVAAMLCNLSIHPEEMPCQSFEDFEHHWAMTKPNGIIAVVETIVHEPPVEMLPKGVEGRHGEEDLEPTHRNLSPSPHPSLHGDPISPIAKHKSPSLQNLRGSLEDLAESSSLLEEDANKVDGSVVCELDAASCDIPLEGRSEALWLNDGELQCAAAEDDDDAQFVRKISEAIRDLDDVLALEKTSSSSGSGTSPEEHSPTKKRFLQLSHEKIDENGVLDFRLDGGKGGVDPSEEKQVARDIDIANEVPPVVNLALADSLQWEEVDMSSTKKESHEACTDDDSGGCRAMDALGGTVQEWTAVVDLRSVGAAESGAKPKTAIEVAQEEEEESWRQRVERGEFSAKVREKSRSVQDLMVLTHIEESSEGSDSEGGRSNAGSPPPLPSCAHPPSFGSVGDLRRAVLGDEFRHTLERLCAANRRAPFSQSDSLHSAVDSNFLEELEDRKSRSETNEQSNPAMSSQDNVRGGKMGLSPLGHSPLQPSHSVTPAVSTPPSSPSKVCSAITGDETPLQGLIDDLSGRKNTEEAQSVPESPHSRFVVESCKNLNRVMTSTPIRSELRNFRVNMDSFCVELPMSNAASQIDCSMIRSDMACSSVSSVDPTFPESEASLSKTVNMKSNHSAIPEIIESETCDLKASVISHKVLGCSSNSNPSLKEFTENIVEKTDSPTENLEMCSENISSALLTETVTDAQNLKDNIKISDSPLSLENSVSVPPLRVLALHCLSSLHPKHLDEKNTSTNYLDKLNPPENNVDISLSVIQRSRGNDETLEKSPQESPLSEFPGELEEQSPLHDLTHGISGSQSTVECRSPLALSPVTVGIDDVSTTTSTTILSVSQQDIMLNDGNSPCEEKFKSDGVTKEINSDFIFSVDPSVENMDAMVKPDLLLDTEKVSKCLPFSGSKVQSDLLGHSNIHFQDNVVEALINNIEVDRNLESWLRPDAVSKGLENSHILLDLVQINSKNIPQSSNSGDILSGINEPNQTVPPLGKKRTFAISPEVSVGVKELNYVNETQDVLNESQGVEKDNPISDIPNSEDCDSAGTEDSVFDFSPPAPDNNGDSVKIVKTENSPQEKQIRFQQDGKCDEGNGLGSREKSDFGATEVNECVGEELGVQRAEQGRVEEEDEELALLGAKQWTPDDERSSDSGFRDKGSLSESVEDACERCDLADVETVAEGEEMDMGGGGEATTEAQAGFMPCEYSGSLNEEEFMNSNDEVYVSANEEEPLKSPLQRETSPPPSDEKREEKQEDFWRQQMASLRQAAGDTASLIREASAPIRGDLWLEGETWEEDAMGSCEELKISSEGDDVDRGLDEASLAALRSELQEKLGGNNCRFGSASMEAKCEGGMYERALSEERLSEEEEDGEEVSEERTDITIHYDAYLAQLSPIQEERESVGSSEMYSPATKEPPRDSVSDDSATTASVNDIGDNQVFLSPSNSKEPAITADDVLVVDTLTNQASFVVNSAIDFQENDATSPEFSDSLEDDDNEENDAHEKSDKVSLKEPSELSVSNGIEKSSHTPVRYNVPPSDFWTGIPSIHSWNGINTSSGASRPSPPRSPLLLPPPPSSAPMPSPEEERAGCVERSGSKKIPIFRDFEDIVALCQNQGDDFSGCNDVAMDGLRGDSQRSSEETEVSVTGAAQNLPFWESESSDGNDSSSSGEFVWKEGERDVPQAGDASALEPVSRVYESLSEFPMAVIEEEDEDEGEKDDGASDSSGSIMEFIPSVWNSAAEPSHSSLRSPDRKSDQKKNVSFKRQKYHCVYEYPKEEASDSESECQDSPPRRQWDVQQVPPFDYSSYADWELMEGDIPEGIIPSDMEVEPEIPNAATNHRQFDFYKLSSEDYDFGFGVSPDASDGEFMVSSSSRPFQYCAPDPSFQVGSQFFPGLGLTANNVPGWVAGRRSSWSKSDEDGPELSESVQGEMEVGSSVVDSAGESVPQDSNRKDAGCCGESTLRVVEGGACDWPSQQPLPSPTMHSSSSSASLSSCSPPISPLSPTGLGELRHTRDRLKLDLPHKFSLCDVTQGPKKDSRAVEGVEGSRLASQSSEGPVDEVKELKVKRRAEEEKGEASLLDAEREREGITKTAL